jgi:hypothetical protein
MKHRTVLVAVALLVATHLLYAHGEQRVVGGSCSYRKITGECRIVSISKTAESIAQASMGGGPGYEGNVIKFAFYSSTGEEACSSLPAETEYTLRLTNAWYPGDRFLEKYDIAEGKVFSCEKHEIIKGTCTPVVFKFPDIDTSDYFETKK